MSQICVNGVLKFQFFFLILSSKFPAGVKVRTSKYPCMDICELHCFEEKSVAAKLQSSFPPVK